MPKTADHSEMFSPELASLTIEAVKIGSKLGIFLIALSLGLCWLRCSDALNFAANVDKVTV